MAVDNNAESTYNVITDSGKFQWNPEKNATNIEKHGISFEEATSSFDDIYALLLSDANHSDEEQRYLLIGMSKKLNVLVVSHCIRGNDEIIRIISARKAEKLEVDLYEKYAKRISGK